MNNPLAETTPSTRGRILGALYLFVIAGGITAQAFIADGLVVRDDAARTAANIVANKSLYRLAFTIFMLEMTPHVGVSALYGGLGWLTFLWPPLGSQAFMAVALFAIVSVIATAGWFFIRGVDDMQWRARAELAATSIWR